MREIFKHKSVKVQKNLNYTDQVKDIMKVNDLIL